MSSFDTHTPASDRYALVVDDHPLVARGMTEFLRLHKHLPDAISVGTAHEALRTIAHRGTPTLALVDFWLADGATTGFISDMLALAPLTRILIVSGDSHPAVVLKARRTGAHGFLHKQHSPEVFTAAITQVLHGGTWFDADIANRDGRHATQTDTHNAREIPLSAADLGLTPRQGEILALMLEGHPNKRIAATLNLSEHTIKEHVTAVLARLGTRNRLETMTKLRGVRLVTT